ncbi:hypothetical protein LCGC14_1029370 [marine sediment metagenome]|uniref:PLD phosphodiesterase domain-containing protein n=1 Tax=marine sediment metagenome TaxID=412755 RepID=A0A0F9NGU4_9ZZZZ
MLADFSTVEKKEIIINNHVLEKVWHIAEDKEFREHLQEFYKPDIWFIGRKRIFEKNIAEHIENAKEIVIICSFLLEQTEIINAILKIVKNSVRVYIVTASENQLEKSYQLESEIEDERVATHKILLKTLRKKCLIRSAPNFHAKYILIDPKLKSRLGFISSANFTKHALSNNIEIGVQLNEKQISDLFNSFCYTFWYESKHEYLRETSLSAVRYAPIGFIDRPDLTHIICPNSNNDFEFNFKRLIENSHGDIYISTYSIDSNNSVFKLILNQLKNGRKIYIYVRPRKKDLDSLLELEQAGAIIRGHSLLHFKCLLIDEDIYKKGIIFTGNLTKESFESSYDIGIFLNSQQYKTTLEILKSWRYLTPAIFFGKANISEIPIGKYSEWAPEKRDFEIKQLVVQDLGTFEGDTIETYQNFRPNDEISNVIRDNVKEIRILWRVTPPILPKDAKLITDIPYNLSKKHKHLLENEKRFYTKNKKKYLLFKRGENYKLIRDLSVIIGAKLVLG